MSTRPLRILVVDDNQPAANALARILNKAGDDVEAVHDGATAIDRIRQHRYDIVLTDLKMEPVDGLAVLDAARAMRPPVEVIVFTAFGEVEVAVRAMRMGARDFLTKPVPVDQILSRLDQLRTGAVSVAPESAPVKFEPMSPAGVRLHHQLLKVADVPTPVWIEGEVGTGRTFTAQTLHELGRKDLPITLMEVGHDVTWPDRGTVVLPSVDELPDDAQRALVRSLRTLPDGVRVIATAEPDARRRIAAGELRPELYYSLAVVVVQIPPLRRRLEDVVPLFEHAMAQHARRYGRQKPDLDIRMIEQLQRHTWPGNIRELVNLAERMVVMGREAAQFEVVPEAAPAPVPSFEAGFSLSDHLEQVERQILVEALRRAGGDRNVAGRILGVERNTLRYKLNKYGLLDS